MGINNQNFKMHGDNQVHGDGSSDSSSKVLAVMSW